MFRLPRHLEFEPPLPDRTSRRMAMATWHRREQNPQAFVAADLDVTRLLRELDARRTPDQRLTLTHGFAAIVGRLQRRVPELRAVLRRGRIYPRRRVSLLIQVAVSRDELSAHVVQDPDRLSPSDIARELDAAVRAMRGAARDPYARANALVDRLPIPVLARLLRAIGHWSYEWNLPPTVFGLRPDPFGALRLNNLGALGVDAAVGPFVDWMHSPGTLVMTRVRAVANPDGTTTHKLRLWSGVDHRLVDGGVFPEARGVIESYLDAPHALWEPAP